MKTGGKAMGRHEEGIGDLGDVGPPDPPAAVSSPVLMEPAPGF